MGVVGGIQEDRLDSLLLQEGDDDGFAARIGFIWPEPAPLVRSQHVPDDRLIDYAFQRLASLEFLGNQPVEIPFCKEAADRMWVWRQAHAPERDSATGLFGSSLGKLPGYIARFALVFEHLKWAAGSDPVPPVRVSLEAVEAAVRFVDAISANAPAHVRRGADRQGRAGCNRAGAGDRQAGCHDGQRPRDQTRLAHSQ